MKLEVRSPSFAKASEGKQKLGGRTAVIAGAVLASAVASVLIVSAQTPSLKPPCSNFTDPSCHPTPPVLTNKATQTVTGDVNVTGKLCAGSGASQVCLPAGASSGTSGVSAGNLTVLKTPVAINGGGARLIGGVTYAPGKIGQAFNFDGTSGRIEVSDQTSQHVSAWTIGLWVYPTGNPSVGGYPFSTLVYKQQLGNGGPYQLQRNNDGSITAGVESWNPGWVNGFWSTGANSVPLNQWTRIDWTYSGNTGNQTDTKIYINGQSQSTTFTGTSYGSYHPIYTDLVLTIGGNRYGNALFRGLIDDVRLYNHVLSSSDIAGLAAVSSSGAPVQEPSGLVGYWTGDTDNTIPEFNAATINVRGLVLNATGADPGPISVAILRSTINTGTTNPGGGYYVFDPGLNASYLRFASGPMYFALSGDSTKNFTTYAAALQYNLNPTSTVFSTALYGSGMITGDRTTTLMPLDGNSQMKAGFWRGGYYCTTAYDSDGKGNQCNTGSWAYPYAAVSNGGELSIIGYYK